MAAERSSEVTLPGAPLRVGVVGLGYWGPNLVRNFMESPLFEVAYLCDVEAAMLTEFRARYPGVACTTRFEDVLSDADVDAVAIATPVSTHYELVSSALSAGKHVFVEKPLARSAEEIIELTLRAEASELVLMPGHTFLYSPPVRAIKHIIDSGELGDIYFISSSRVNLGPLRHDVDVVWDLGPHDFSILRYWLDSVPEEVSAISRSCLRPEHSDVCFINLRYGSGIVAHVELSWLSPSKLRRTTVVGSKKMVVYDDTSNEPVRIFDSGVNMPDPKTFGEFQLSLRTGDILAPRIEATEPLSLQLEDFAAAIRDKKPLVSSPEIGLDVVRTIEAVTRSLTQGGLPVRLGGAGASEPVVEARVAIDAPEPRDTSATEIVTIEPSEDVGTAILGGGPAGLTAAYVLGRRGRPAAVFDADGTVGGIA
jgi:predicted dehydrogenase